MADLWPEIHRLRDDLTRHKEDRARLRDRMKLAMTALDEGRPDYARLILHLGLQRRMRALSEK